ncbi:hypothetical protein GH714_002429 [Hevea brasiliensis]|uniref:Uncharacterized protein n=1 Tax=Hevea brasiliensis TaxID=3981 RepID=A0A6A6K3G5_HEVBR|nr:hypothetical protein GH714_002429 [Hevea brasiliensis]
MEKRSGSARNVQRNTQFNQIGKLMARSVAPESTDATVAPSSPACLPEFVHTAQMNMFGSASSQAQWLNKYQEAQLTGGSNLSMSALPRGLKVEEGNTGDLSESLTSLYSSNQHQQQKNSAHMSATALLQKAAQMGSTKSNPASVPAMGFH